MEYVLKTNSLCKTYRKFSALNGLTMNVPQGAIYGFVGRNGAGKTTLIRLICGLQDPTGGDLTLYGTKHTDKKIAKARRHMGAVVETPAYYGDMNAAENLKMQYAMLGLPSYDGIDDLLRLVRLDDTGKKKAKDYSLGMKQRLGIALALCGNPDFLILDEPINGLDPQGIVEIRELILRLNHERDITVLISSHILDELSRLATHYGFIDKGKIVQEINAEELEQKCRKYLHVKVTNTAAFAHVMDKMGAEYSIISDTEADLYGEYKVSDISAALAAEHCELLSLTEHEESLENYFLNLVGSDGGDRK
ncbi:MAG: ATP-binding cassette domain-containing protein [Oscillospiraceae bacterium]|nr:ATP-binding cassette domain-containing protein [Oscillospiraceae bacterium]